MSVKTINFIIFFSAFFAVYSLVNVYIFIKIGRILPHNTASKAIYIISCVLVSFSFLAGRLLEKVTICTVSDFFIWVGSFWMAFMVYLLIFFLCKDFLFASNRLLHWMPHVIADNPHKMNVISTVVIMITTAVIVFAGHLNSISPVVKKFDISIDKPAGNVKKLNVVMVSDIHLGIIISNSRLRTLVHSINELEPDIVLLVGDIVDEDITPVIEQNLGETLRNIKARYGTFAITGNHEFIGGVEKAVAYLKDHNIRVLRDRYVLIDNAFYLAGREDRSVERFNGTTRKSLSEILKDVDASLPVILMDHQHNDIDEGGRAGVDLQLSGHTHHGQLWPFNHITSAIFSVSYGYKKINNTHVYVSSGYGTWGPPVRTSSRAEIVNIHIRFKE